MPRPIRRIVTPRRRRVRGRADWLPAPWPDAPPDLASTVPVGTGAQVAADEEDPIDAAYRLLLADMGIEPDPEPRMRIPRGARRHLTSDAVVEERRGFPMPWREAAPDPKAWKAGEPLSTRESDPPEFVARVEAEAQRRLGGTLEDVVPEPELREMMYNAFAEALRQEPRPIAPEIAALAARLAEHGMILTPGSGDVRDLPKPVSIPGVTLSDAVIEERYGY